MPTLTPTLISEIAKDVRRGTPISTAAEAAGYEAEEFAELLRRGSTHGRGHVGNLARAVSRARADFKADQQAAIETAAHDDWRAAELLLRDAEADDELERLKGLTAG